MHPLLAALPIVVLVAAMTVRMPRAGLPLPADRALPGAAVLALLLQAVAGTESGATMLAARVIEGLLTALIPLAIVFGAILLFRTMRTAGALAAITYQLERAVPDPVLRVVLVAWSFSYLVEGLSGFGTPAALAAPLLVGLGFPPVRAAAACLVMNTVPVVFGAVGMPIWFGLGEIDLTAEQLRAVGLSAGVIQCAAAPVVVALALRLLFPWKAVRARILAVGAIVAATVGSAVVTAMFSTEFPTIVGGTCRLAIAYAVGRRVGEVEPHASEPAGDPPSPSPPPDLAIGPAMFPLVATVILLAVTRFEPFGLRDLLQTESPAATIDVGPVGTFSISATLVARLADILGTGISWSMALLYVPFIIPFVVVVLVSAPLLRLSARRSIEVAGGAACSLTRPAIALAGALVFVKLMMHGGEEAPVVTIGRGLADVVSAVHGPLWLGAAPVVGALGSFFSGSATVSNLTFGPVQAEIARQVGLETEQVLALQAVGAALGNMVCVHNIVAVAAVLGLTSGRTPPADDETPDDAPTDAEPPSPPPSSPSGEDPVARILRLNAIPLAATLIVVAAVAGLLAVA